MVTAYDYTSALLVQSAGIQAILVGDSLGMVVQGDSDTLAVTLDDTIYHTKWVVRGAPQAFIIADMPFMSYQPSVEDALRSAGRVLKETKAQAVKLEGGLEMVPQVEALVAAGIPVMGHIGMQPQSFNQYGGYGKQAKTAEEQAALTEKALALEQAGVFSMVLENIAHEAARQTTEALSIPTIGIGAGLDCDGQIQVFHDILGLIPEFKPRHTQRFGEIGASIIAALGAYADAVRQSQFVSK